MLRRSPPSLAVPEGDCRWSAGGTVRITIHEREVSGHRRPFVGRRRELAVLRGALDDASGGRGRLMLVTGEAGVGKTRLAEEIGLEALRRKAPVAWGRCHEGEGVSAFFPWVQILRAFVRDLEVAHLRRLASAAGAILGNVAPAIGERLPDLPTPPPIESAADRVRLFDSVARFLERMAKDAP